MELIEEIRLYSLTNSLYAQYMEDVDKQIQRLTPTALKISKCYTAFTAGKEQFDEAYKQQTKNNLTEELLEKDQARDDRYRCFLGHVKADINNVEAEKRAAAKRILNWIGSFKDVLRATRRAQSADMTEMGAKLSEEPLSADVELLGQTENLNQMIAANEAYKELSLERTETRKDTLLNAVKEARTVLDDAYRNVVAMVNSQVTLRELSDEADEEESGSDGPSIQSLSEPVDVLTDFVRSINALIKEYKTEVAQSGANPEPDDETETPEEPETPEEGTTETPDTEEPTQEEPDDRPTV